MLPIRSIICFNGGSAGDFLTGVCSEQLLGKSTYQILSKGLAQLSSPFKQTVMQSYYNNSELPELKNTLPIENAHFFLNSYSQIAHKLFFIDYSDTITNGIVEIYMIKRFQNSAALLADSIKENYTGILRDKINQHNVVDVCNINWLKNVKSWRNNPLLEPLQLKDYFDRPVFYNMVETVCQQKVQNYETLAAGYDNWISKNDQLRQLLL